MEPRVVSNAIVVMGVSGSGKSTVGRALGLGLGFEFIEGDQLHSSHNIERMASGHALSDEERLPWLNLVGRAMAQGLSDHPGVVAACSALKRSYRDVLRLHEADVFFVALEAPIATIEARVLARPHSLLPPALLSSQFETLEPLEPDERGIRVDATLRAPLIVTAVERALRAKE
ncbi:MAG TPA: gluconokinase [Acidimicrobiales bacterium]|nr:gluconokinase [Acidimicrobiales bacterium]